jgi:hypothetical protein
MADDDADTLQLIARHLIVAARPLIDAGSSLGAFSQLMGRIGFFASDIPAPYKQLATRVSDAADAIETFPSSPSLQDVLGLLDKAKGIYDAVQGLKNGPVPSGADAASYASEIGERLFELLLTDYLAAEQPGARNVLAMLNVITTEHIAATPTRPSYVRTHFRWEEIPKIVSDPGGLPTRVYNWGQNDFKDHLVLEHVGALGRALGLPVAIRESDEDALNTYRGTPGAFPPPSGRSLVLPLFYANIEDVTIEGGLALQRLPGQGTAPPGLILEPLLPSQMPLEFALAPSAKINVRSGTNVGQLFGITLRPPDQVDFVYPFAPGTPPPSAGVGVGFTYTPPAPVALLGDPKASHIELAGAAAGFTADVSTSGVSFGASADLHGLKLVIAAGEGDGFLHTILGDTPAAIDVPLGFEWSQAHGIRFKGSAAFEIGLHPHLQLGPLRIDNVTVKVSTPTDGPPQVNLEAGADIAGQLGPVSFLVAAAGFRATVTFADGNAGPFDLGLGFKPPKGVGLEISGGGFAGGGFLVLDPDKGEYTGGLELMFEDTISVRAIGILDTKMPDGSTGFSLLILIVTEFPPIQLSFGFTLLGVGGLLGLNRGAAFDVLQASVRDGTLQSILFPTDVVANAPRIIGDLQRVFPAQNGLFLIGPMAKLGWPTPTLVYLEIGLIIDLPRPIFALIGLVHAALPADDVPVLVLQVSFVGVIDIAAGKIEFDASLFDSRVLTFTLTGDMAARVYLKEDANLLVTVGGFNPSYTPPPLNLPALRRIAVVLFEGNPDVRAEGYFAVTSNTVQFGARLELSYGFSAFNVYGFLGFDVLIHPLPFSFVADIAGMIAVRTGDHVLFSIRLELTLEGPTPLHARGTASFEIGFIFTITIHVRFDVTVDTGFAAAALAPVDVLAKIVEALTNPGNWLPRFPPAANQSVSLRALPEGSPSLVLHPFGALQVSQRVAPLGIDLQRFGSTVPEKPGALRIVDVLAGGQDPGTVPAHEEFAPAQFFEMTDAEALSRPSFDQFESGVLIGDASKLASDFMRVREVAYEVIYVPEGHPVQPRFGIGDLLAKFVAAGAAVAQSPLSNAQRAPSPLADRVMLADSSYVIVSADDLTPHAPDLVFDNAVVADRALRQLLQSDPSLSGAVQVVPSAILDEATA